MQVSCEAACGDSGYHRSPAFGKMQPGLAWICQRLALWRQQGKTWAENSNYTAKPDSILHVPAVSLTWLKMTSGPLAILYFRENKCIFLDDTARWWKSRDLLQRFPCHGLKFTPLQKKKKKKKVGPNDPQTQFQISYQDSSVCCQALFEHWPIPREGDISSLQSLNCTVPTPHTPLASVVSVGRDRIVSGPYSHCF
jgi:hypothetical protein